MEALDFLQNNDFIEYVPDLEDDAAAETNVSAFNEDEGEEEDNSVESGESGEISTRRSRFENDQGVEEFKATKKNYSRSKSNGADEVEGVDHDRDTHNVSASGAEEIFGNTTQMSNVGLSADLKLQLSHNQQPCFSTSLFATPVPVNSLSPSLSAMQAKTAPTYPSVFNPFGTSSQSSCAPPATLSSVFSTFPISAGTHPFVTSPVEKTALTPAPTSFFQPQDLTLLPSSAASHGQPVMEEGLLAGEACGFVSAPPPSRGPTLHSKAGEGVGFSLARRPAGGHNPRDQGRVSVKGVNDIRLLRFPVFPKGIMLDRSSRSPRTRETEPPDPQMILCRFQLVIPVKRLGR